MQLWPNPMTDNQSHGEELAELPLPADVIRSDDLFSPDDSREPSLLAAAVPDHFEAEFDQIYRPPPVCVVNRFKRRATYVESAAPPSESAVASDSGDNQIVQLSSKAKPLVTPVAPLNRWSSDVSTLGYRPHISNNLALGGLTAPVIQPRASFGALSLGRPPPPMAKPTSLGPSFRYLVPSLTTGTNQFSHSSSLVPAIFKQSFGQLGDQNILSDPVVALSASEPSSMAALHAALKNQHIKNIWITKPFLQIQ